MESRVIGNFHARFGAGENLEIISKDYLSLKVSTLHLVVGVAHIKVRDCTFTGTYAVFTA